MDNNPFRSQNANMYTGMPSGQGQFPQSNPMPSTSNFGNSNLLVDTSLPGSTQQQQQQPLQQPYYSPQQQQHPQQSFYQPMSNQQFGYSQAPQQHTTTPTTTYPFMQQQQQQPSSFFNPTQSFGYGGSFQNGVTSFPQYQQQPQPYDPSNVFIPQNFGMSSGNNNPGAQQFQQQPTMPQRPTVDASTYLKKSGKVRKEECPICHKMIEGDDPAINHHVNEHLEYDM